MKTKAIAQVSTNQSYLYILIVLKYEKTNNNYLQKNISYDSKKTELLFRMQQNDFSSIAPVGSFFKGAHLLYFSQEFSYSKA